MHKLIREGMNNDVYKCSLVANGCLSEWNTQVMLINKVNNPELINKLQMAFNYYNIFKQMSGNYLELLLKVHDYLSDSYHLVFFSADLKHAYYTVSLYLDN